MALVVSARPLLSCANFADRVEGSGMSVPVVDPNTCTACGTCVDECPSGCYELEEVAVLARPDDCTECGICVDSCSSEAISMD